MYQSDLITQSNQLRNLNQTLQRMQGELTGLQRDLYELKRGIDAITNRLNNPR